MALLKVERAQGKGAKGVFSTTALLPFLPCPRPRRHLGVLADAAATRATPRRLPLSSLGCSEATEVK